ncbi:MAG TPA: choice-of-anchor tandem repeat GloVer-containing protein [Rhizomicrobium sp.]|jgi:uncharacterized repeat protein (TIGR03803 family)|nr:choice-of-anchor tandem repeat GloVer-containing protein [Rhizomicrobium sp.]
MRARDVAAKSVLIAGTALALAAVPVGAHAVNLKVLYTFTGGSDGYSPRSGLIRDKAGNLYGTTLEGGAGCCGTVFRLAPDGTETTLYSFQGGANDGNGPNWLVVDKAGNLYGTTGAGGGSGCFDETGCGTVFRLRPDGTETVLYAFTGGSDGFFPTSLVPGNNGNLYGTTGETGYGGGTIFRIAPDGTQSEVYSFTSGGIGGPPAPGLIRDSAGNFYGVAEAYGANGYGSVFKVSPHGKQTVLYAFTGGNDGGEPMAGLTADAAGNLYGTTAIGGDENCYPGGCGTVFKLAADGTFTVLYAFHKADNNASPRTRLVLDGAGNLYGTTDAFSGGVFRLAPDGTETVLHSFTDGSDGGLPLGDLIADRKGHLYGTADEGGSGCEGFGCGVVFEIKE